MSKTILAQVDGWTPVIDGVVDDVGAITALIFGKMWRYCQMSDGVCRASQERIADELGMSRQTINAHIEKLVSAGYMQDMTPELVGLPHQYRDTGKANLSINLTGSSQKSLQPPVKKFDTKKLPKTQERNKYNDNILEKMIELGYGATSNTNTLIMEWKKYHSEERIVEALEKYKGKGESYVDKVLCTWQANGYPKTAEEKIAEAKKRQQYPTINDAPRRPKSRDISKL